MAEESYKEYLAARVLTDSRPVTYRVLSRALKVHVNIAKQMLYEFYTKQNAKKPKSIHATYLLTGKKRVVEHANGVNGRDGEDSIMHSSPYMSSMPEPEEPAEEPVLKTSIVLVREEELERTKGEFEDITSIHIYSLEPGPIENLNILSLCNQEVATEYASEDPLERWRMYGCIHNPYVKRRTTKYTPAPPKAASKPTVKPTAAATAAAKEVASDPPRRGSASEDNKPSRSTPQPGPATASLKRSDSKSNLKKDKTAGDLFKSFAKAKPKAKEEGKSKDSTPAPPEDEQMQGMSEDEGDADDEPMKIDQEKEAEARKAREDRKKKLDEMMEADVEMEDAPSEEEKDSQDAPLDKETPTNPAESEAVVTVQGGRRRGRRKVMKKKKVKDEDGYLVTKEEAVWESFSEDEPEPKRPKPAPKPAAPTKGKKPGGKAQGSIASFFKKA